MARCFLYLAVFISLATHSTYAANFCCILEDGEDSIESLNMARKLIMDKSQSFAIDDKSVVNKVFVCVNNSEAFDFTLDMIPEEFHIPGKLPRTIIDSLEYYKTQLNKNETSSSTEFIFTGYGNNGKIAVALSALWLNEYTKIKKQPPRPNQIKVITFFASNVGDDEFNDFMKTSLGQNNILDFSTYFSSYFQSPTHCGIPILILPDEQFIESIKNINYYRLGTEMLSYVKLALVFMFFDIAFKSYNTTYPRESIIHERYATNSSALVVYNPVCSSQSALRERYTNNSTELVVYNPVCRSQSALYERPANNSSALVVYDPVCPREPNWEPQITLLTKMLLVLGDDLLVNNIFIASVLFSLCSCLYDEYSNYNFVPSEELLAKAFYYTKSNYLSEQALETIGSSPLFTIRRGVGEKLINFLGL
jgi:hypothetical protein